MNNYYAFNNEVVGTNIDFHLWMVIFIVAIAIMVVIGIRQYQMVDLESGEIRLKKLHKDIIYLVITAVSTGIFAIVFTLTELQQNGVFNSKPIFAILVFALIVYFTGKITSWARFGYLHEKRNRRRNK